MENFAHLMHRLLEVQSDGRQRIAEDERLMDRLQKRTLTGKRPQRAWPSCRGVCGIRGTVEGSGLEFYTR